MTSMTAGEPVSYPVADVFDEMCTSRSTLQDVAGKWPILVLLALHDGDFRFNALRRRVSGVSEKMLSQTLQSLERDGLVIREVQTAIPPRVEYSLSPLGARVAQRLREVADVFEESVAEVEAARREYDAHSMH